MGRRLGTRGSLCRLDREPSDTAALPDRPAGALFVGSTGGWCFYHGYPRGSASLLSSLDVCFALHLLDCEHLRVSLCLPEPDLCSGFRHRGSEPCRAPPALGCLRPTRSGRHGDTSAWRCKRCHTIQTCFERSSGQRFTVLSTGALTLPLACIWTRTPGTKGLEWRLRCSKHQSRSRSMDRGKSRSAQTSGTPAIGRTRYECNVGRRRRRKVS